MTGLPPTDGPLTFDELQQATRNRGMPLEGLRYDLTPTGMHYLLIHWDIPATDAASHAITIGGNVENPASLSMDDIRSFPKRTMPVTMECAGNGRARLKPRPVSQPWLLEAIGTAEWAGASLPDVLGGMGIRDGTVELLFTGADHGLQGDVEQDYQRSLTLDEALRPEVLLAYEMNGRSLEPQHGAPVRLLVPGWYGMTSVKWLTGIEAITEPFEGYQQTGSYMIQETEGAPGRPVQRIRVRALMIPPGFPDFPARRRYVEAGTVTLQGRAWCGSAPVIRVEVGVDDLWEDAKLEPPVGEFAWAAWSYDWTATPGDHELSCRATDANGHTQPLEQPWNYQGMENNLVQTVAATVR